MFLNLNANEVRALSLIDFATMCEGFTEMHDPHHVSEDDHDEMRALFEKYE